MEGFNDVWANILNDDILNIHDMTFKNNSLAAVIDHAGIANLNLVSNIEDSALIKAQIWEFASNPLENTNMVSEDEWVLDSKNV